MNTSEAAPLRGTVLAIYAMSYFCAFGNPLLMPLMPFVAEEFALTPFRQSLLIACYALPGACILPVFGVLEDRFGRKPMLMAGITLSIISSCMCFLSPSYNWLLFWRAVQGMSVTPLEALSNTLITDNFQGQERMRHLGHCVGVMYVGVSTFPLISGAMLYFTGEWRYSFLIPVALAVLLFCLWVRRPMRYNAAEAPSMSQYLGNVRSALRSRRLLNFYFSRILMALIMFGVVYAYLSVLITDKLNASPHLVGPLFSVFSGSLALSCLLSGWLTRHLSLPWLGFGCGLTAALSMLGLWLAPSALWLAPFLSLYGLAQGMLTALLTLGVASCTTPDTRATILSLYSTLFRFSQSSAPVIGSWLFLQGGFTLMLLSASATGLVLAVQNYVAFRQMTGGAE